MSFEYKVFQVQGGNHAGKWTFTVDGAETLIYCPTEYAARRKVQRLQQGRTDALGGPVLMTGGGPVRTAAPRARVFREDGEPSYTTTRAGKRREVPKGWRFELDGTCCQGTYATEAEAREACAVRAYLTRGKLGRLKEAEEAFVAQHGKPCEVKVQGGKITAHAEDGSCHSVGFFPGQVRFKEIG